MSQLAALSEGSQARQNAYTTTISSFPSAVPPTTHHIATAARAIDRLYSLGLRRAYVVGDKSGRLVSALLEQGYDAYGVHYSNYTPSFG